MAEHRIRNVAVLAPDRVSPFELAVACEVFGLDRSAQGLPRPDFAVVRWQRGPIATLAGFGIDTPHRLDRAAVADLLIMPSWPDLAVPPPAAVCRTLRAAVDRGAWVLGFCSGVFALAYAGLLAGRRATTHWFYAADFAARFPDVELDPAVLYVADDGPVMTSAGTAAAIDLCLHVVRTVEGPDVANAIARRMVVPPHREGGQAQYVDLPVPAAADSLAPLLEWMTRHLAIEQPVEELARRAMMSPRTFARRFRAETGTTPHHWLTGQRVLHAQQLLETTEHDVEAVARLCGLGNAATLRHHFTHRVGTPPLRYRQAFRRAVLAS
ncbi:MAG TPA: helix-turn-helix domain-containing protein [Mycobacteriales bacterium]|nr:helix-turn-helix domain-containing protein [Mycobacteriales bacterium]